jgi:putative ABC transport system permease protein
MNLGLLFSIGPLTPVLLHLARRRSVVRSRAVTRLGLANVVRDPGRTGIMATAVGAAVVVAFLTASFNLSVHDGVEANLLRSQRDWVAVSNLDVDTSASIDAKIPPDVIQRIKAVPGVRRVQRQLTVVTGHDPGQLRAVQGWDDPWLDQDVIVGTKDPSKLRSGEVLIGPALARTTGTRPGDTLQLATPKGFVAVPVQGVWQEGNFNGNSITMDVDAIERLYGPQPVGNLSVLPVAGVTPEELARRLRAAQLDPALKIYEPAELLSEISESVGGQLAPFWAIQRALMLVAFVAVLSTLLLIGVQRKRELGLLAAVGMRPRELSAMVLSEAGGVGVVAMMLSAFSGALAMAGFIWITPILIGFRDPYRLDFAAFVVYGAITLVIVLAAAAVPAWRSSRIEVVEALQYE